MNSSESFWALDRQLLHQWGNDIVAETGYLELLATESLRPSTKQIVQKLNLVGAAHKLHVELYRRALAIFKHTDNSSKSRVADIRQALMVAQSVAQSFGPLKFDFKRQKPLALVTIDQTQLNNVITFSVLLVQTEMQPSYGKIGIRFRQRPNYISTALDFRPKKNINSSSLQGSGLVFLQAILSKNNGAVELRISDNTARLFLRLPVSKQLKLI